MESTKYDLLMRLFDLCRYRGWNVTHPHSKRNSRTFYQSALEIDAKRFVSVIGVPDYSGAEVTDVRVEFSSEATPPLIDPESRERLFGVFDLEEFVSLPKICVDPRY